MAKCQVYKTVLKGAPLKIDPFALTVYQTCSLRSCSQPVLSTLVQNARAFRAHPSPPALTPSKPLRTALTPPLI